MDRQFEFLFCKGDLLIYLMLSQSLHVVFSTYFVLLVDYYLLILIVAVSFYKLSQLKTLKVRQKVATTKIQKAEEAENQEGSDEYGGKFPL